MGDWVRRICYPLILPAIVLAVWAHAWSAKMESGHVRIPAPPQAAGAAGEPPAPRWVPDYHLSAGEDDGFASAAGD